MCEQKGYLAGKKLNDWYKIKNGWTKKLNHWQKLNDWDKIKNVWTKKLNNKQWLNKKR
jgi:hypothetical protein